MRNLFCTILLCLGVYVHAQVASVQLSAGDGKFVLISAATTTPVGVLRLDLPDEGSVIVSDGNIDEYAWVLGGNASPALNQLGTTTNTDLVFVTGANGPNTRMTLTASGMLNVGSASQFQVDGSSGNISKIRNLNYNFPGSHGTGYLQNDGSGNLSWQSSIQASRAGIGSWFENNFGGPNAVADVAGTTISFIIPPFNGAITGISMVIDPPLVDNTAPFESIRATVRKAVPPTYTPTNTTVQVTVTANAAGSGFAFVTSPGVSFNAGDQISVFIEELSAAANVDVLVTVFATF